MSRDEILAEAVAAALGPEAAVAAPAAIETPQFPVVAFAAGGVVLLVPEALAPRIADPAAVFAAASTALGFELGRHETTTVAIEWDGGQPSAWLTFHGETCALVLPPVAQNTVDPESLRGVPVRVWAELGRTRLPIGRAVGLAPGTVVELDQAADDPVDLFVSGRRFARGSLVLIDGEWAVEVVEILGGSAS